MSFCERSSERLHERDADESACGTPDTEEKDGTHRVYARPVRSCSFQIVSNSAETEADKRSVSSAPRCPEDSRVERTRLLNALDVFEVKVGERVFAGRRAHQLEELLIVERHASEDLHRGTRDTTLVRRRVAVENDAVTLELETSVLRDEQVRTADKNPDQLGTSALGTLARLTLRRCI